MRLIIGTCGHQISTLTNENQVKIMDIAIDHDLEKFVRVVSCGVYCEECVKEMYSWGIVLSTPEEERFYLCGKLQCPSLTKT
jgi:hypothetical protein